LKSRIAWTLDERRALVADAKPDAHCRCLVAAGGDGTVLALINEQPEVPVTVLAAGTENLFAQHFGLRTRPEKLAEIITAGHVARIDLGLAGGRRFALMAGVGFDADVVTRHHKSRLGRVGKVRPTNRAAYVESILRSSWEYRFPTLRIAVVDPGCEETLTGTTAFLFNLPRYALGLPMAPGARANDGLLDLIVFRNAGPLNALRYLWMVFRGLHLDLPDVVHRTVRGVVISSVETVPVQLDGDPGGLVVGGETSWTAEVLPGALNVVVAPSYAHRHSRIRSPISA
jgi:diacylglycerol kinase family enzyme